MTKYEELCEKQLRMANIWKFVGSRVRIIYLFVKKGDAVDLDLELNTVAKNHNIPFDELLEYYEYIKTVVDRAVVYYSHSSRRFGYTVGEEVMPLMSVTVALLTREGAVYSGINMSNRSQTELLEVLQEGLLKVGFLKSNAEQLIRVGSIGSRQ